MTILDYGNETRGAQRGVTLIELVVVVLIVAVLAVMGVPAILGIMVRSNQHNLAHSLKEAMTQTRTEAIKRNQRVTVCPTLGGAFCEGEAWDKGWIIFVDPNHNATREKDEEIVYTQKDHFPNIRATGNTPVRHYVSFASDGRPQTKTGALQMGTFTVCGQGVEAFNVVFSISGNTRIEQKPTGCGEKASP